MEKGEQMRSQSSMIRTIRNHIAVILLLISDSSTFSFSLLPHRTQRQRQRHQIAYQSRFSQRQASIKSPDVTSTPEPSPQELEYLKTELTSYLEKRKEFNADEEAMQ
jgi:hypothetical protein